MSCVGREHYGATTSGAVEADTDTCSVRSLLSALLPWFASGPAGKPPPRLGFRLPPSNDFRLQTAKAVVQTAEYCESFSKESARRGGDYYRTSRDFCVRPTNVKFCGGDSGGAMYTLGKQGGKTVALVHGIYTVRLDAYGRELGRREGRGHGRSLRVGAGVETTSRGAPAVGWRDSTDEHQTNRLQTIRRGARALFICLPAAQDGWQRHALCRVDARFGDCGCITQSIAVFLKIHEQLKWIRPRIWN